MGGSTATNLNVVEIVHLRADDVSLVLQAQGGRVPRVVHWGRSLEDMSAAALAGMCRAQEAPVQDGDEPDASTAPALIPLASDGWLGRPGLVGHRVGGAAWAPRLRTRSIEADVEGLAIEAEPVPTATGGPGVLVFHLADAETGLAVDLTVELLPQGLIRLRATCANTGGDVYELDELSVALPLPLTADEILDFSGRWGREREPQRRPVPLGVHLREGRRGRTGFDAPMMMFCGERGFAFGGGRVRGLHVAHSGNHRAWVERLPTGVQVIGGGELLLPGEVALQPGEAYTSPWVYAQSADGLDRAARMVHRWERSLPSHPGPDRPVALNVWEAVYFTHDLDTLKGLADRAARIGVERYIVDDGWFLGRRDERRGLGDWEVDPAVWPQGLHPLVDHVRARGMQFGLWFEPEMASIDSDVVRAHPEWVLRARADALPVEKRFQQVLNLAIPEAWEHVRSRMDALIREYRIDYIKWDHNRDLLDAGDTRHAGRATVHEQALACYRLMDRLRADHPGLEIESCSSGGGRVDLEMVRHVQRFWLSDCIDPVERQSIQRWSAQILAPELMGTHVASSRSHTTGRVSDLSFRAATALWGHMGLEIDLLSLDEAEVEALAEWIAFYQQNRDLLLTGDLVRRDEADGTLSLTGAVSPSRDRALFALTALARSPLSPRGSVSLPGLEAGRDYLVRPVLVGGGPSGLTLPAWAERSGVVMDGAALEEVGVHSPMIFPDQTLLIEVRDAAGGGAATVDSPISTGVE